VMLLFALGLAVRVLGFGFILHLPTLLLLVEENFAGCGVVSWIRSVFLAAELGSL
jgi:hypothetical protein